MSSLFSSPSKQAQQAAQISEDAAAKEIGSPGAISVPQAGGNAVTIAPTGSGLEGYVQQGQEASRAAIAGLGPNPQYGAAAAVKPQMTNPANTTTFSTPGPRPAPMPGAQPPGPNAFAAAPAMRQPMPAVQQRPPGI